MGKKSCNINSCIHYNSYIADCAVFSRIPLCVEDSDQCGFFEPASESTTKHEQMKQLLKHAKNISDKCIEILAEIAAERMEK